MEEITPAPRTPARLSILRFVHDRNPFYLLSALCLFVGFRVILGALNSHAGEWPKLLLLIGILNVYEFTIIALGLFLIVKRSLLRDGWFLLSIEALFLVDLTNLNAELYIASPRIGTVVNAVLWLLAMIKIAVVVRSLRLKLSVGTAGYIAVQMAFMLGLPGLFWIMRAGDASISPMQIYGTWWVVAGLIVAGAPLVQRPTGFESSPMATLPWRLYVLVPLVSLLVHLAGQNRVYWVHFHPANLSPIVMAIAVLMTYSRSRFHPMAIRRVTGLVVISVLISVLPQHYAAELTTPVFGIAITPLRIALLCAAGVMLRLALTHRSLMAANGSAVSLALAGFGSTPWEMRHTAGRLARWTIDTAEKMVPDSQMQWGIFAVTAAFALLAVGAFFSLYQKPVAVIEQPEPDLAS